MVTGSASVVGGLQGAARSRGARARSPFPGGRPPAWTWGGAPQRSPPCAPGGAGPGSPRTPAHPRMGAPLATPPHLRNAGRAFPATPAPLWATVLGTLGAAAAHASSGGHTRGGAHCWGWREWGDSIPGAVCTGMRTPEGQWDLDPWARLSSEGKTELGEWTQGRCRGWRVLSVPGGVALTPVPQPACPGPTTLSMKGSGTSTQ